MPRIIPEPRYFPISSIELRADVLRNRALNCCPWARSLIHSPDAVIHSPAETIAAWPTTVTRSRCPRAFARSTQKPFSALWKVTRSTSPASTSWVDGSELDFIRIARASLLISRRAVVPSRAEHVSSRDPWTTVSPKPVAIGESIRLDMTMSPRGRSHAHQSEHSGTYQVVAARRVA